MIMQRNGEMTAEFFTPAEISAILFESTEDCYLSKNVWFPTFTKCQIAKISDKGLIFVHGNSHTGLTHIRERHSLTSRKLYPDYPGKLSIAPIEYPTVADAIYNAANLNNSKNTCPDFFTIYIGPYTHKNGKTYNYLLALYSHTRIVHTFYLKENSKPFNKKINLRLRQGWSYGKYNTSTGVGAYYIDYRDRDDIVKFTVLLRSDSFHRKERWYLQVYKNNQQFFTHFVKEDHPLSEVLSMPRTAILDYQDVSFVDSVIKKIMEHKYDFQDGFRNFWNYHYE